MPKTKLPTKWDLSPLFTDNIPTFQNALSLLAQLHSQNIMHGDLWVRNIADNDGVITLFDAFSVIDITSKPTDAEVNKYSTYFEQAEEISSKYFDKKPSLREMCIVYELYMVINSREVQELIRSSQPEIKTTMKINTTAAFNEYYIPYLQAEDVDFKDLTSAFNRLLDDLT